MSTLLRDHDHDEDNESDGVDNENQTPDYNTTTCTDTDLPRLHSFVQVSPGKVDLSESLDIEQGENWLRLADRDSAHGSSILDQTPTTQDTTTTTTGNDCDAPYPSVLSLKELGSIDMDEESSQGCFLCIDADGPYLAIKDTRSHSLASLSSQGTHNNGDKANGTEYSYELRIARKGQSTLVSSSLERLPRRQLRLLHHGDRLCVLSSASGAVTLVLEYRHDVAIRTTPVRGESQSQSEHVDVDASMDMDMDMDNDDTLLEVPVVGSQSQITTAGGSEIMALTQQPTPHDAMNNIPLMSTQPESEDVDDESTVDPDQDKPANSGEKVTTPQLQGGGTTDGRGTGTRSTELIARSQPACSTPGDQSSTLYGETEPPALWDDQNNEVLSHVHVPLAVVNETEAETLVPVEKCEKKQNLDFVAESVNGGEDEDDDDKRPHEAETAAVATPQKEGVHNASPTKSDIFLSPNLLASPCSLEGSPRQKKGTDALIGPSNDSEGVKLTDTQEMCSSDAETATERSVTTQENKVIDKAIETSADEVPQPDDAILDIMSAENVDTSKDMPSDPSGDAERLKRTEIDKLPSKGVGEAGGTAVLGAGEAKESKAGDDAIGAGVLIKRPHPDEATGNIASVGNALASDCVVTNPSIVDGGKGDSASSEVSSSSPNLPVGVEQSGDNEAASSANRDTLGHVGAPAVVEPAQQEGDGDVSSTDTGGTTSTRSTRRRGRSSPAEDLDMSSPTVEVDIKGGPEGQSAEGEARATRKRERVAPSKEVDSKHGPEEQSAGDEAIAGTEGGASDHASVPPVGEADQQYIDRCIPSTNGTTPTTVSKRKRGRSSPTEEVDINLGSEAVTMPDGGTRSARKRARQSSVSKVTRDAVAGDVAVRVLVTRIEMKPKEKSVSHQFCHQVAFAIGCF
jgi:hypothetical protein